MEGSFEKAALIGTGLIGGSLALALKRTGKLGVVHCYDISPETREKARKLKIADRVFDNCLEAVEGSDLVVIATPVGSVLNVFLQIRDYLKRGCVVTDTGSAKSRLVREMEKAATEGVSYIGGHPMTGSEQSGVEWARADLFEDAYYILTPTENTDTESFRRIHGLLTGIGARVISMEPDAHDRAMATVSHVPHLLSLLLMEMAADERKNHENLFTIVAGGFRDMTRIAASSPDLWIDICFANRDFIVERLKDYSMRIRDLTGILEEGNREELLRKFNHARRARLEISVKKGKELEEMYDISLPVPDRPGVISGITTAIGGAGVNIEDISLTHPLVGETGILTIKVLGEENALKATNQLSRLGYKSTLRKS